jgi:hypothetical protein
MIEVLNFFQTTEGIRIIGAIATSSILALATYYLKPKSKIVWGVSLQFAFSVRGDDGSTILSFSRTVWVKNLGRKTAEWVEVIFAFQPQHMQI